MFDFSDYPQDSKFFDPLNKTLLVKWKMKSKKTRFSEFIGLKSKIYSLVDVDDDESKKEKNSMES